MLCPPSSLLHQTHHLEKGKMATNQLLSCNRTADDLEDYIDMEVSSTSSNNFFCYSISSPPQTREFEFQMTSSVTNGQRETTTSPADELFDKGNLLPLHIPPRLQMVQKILQSSNHKTEEAMEENCQSESRRVSCELNPDEYFFEWSIEMNGFIRENHPNKSWSKRFKQSAVTQKLKASRAYLKSLFSKSESCAKAACNVEAENKYLKVAKKNPFGKIDNDKFQISTAVMKRIDREMVEDAGGNNNHRRSFSGVIQRHSAIKSSSSSGSSSSSFSLSSNGFYNLQLLKRSSSSVSSEIESSIEGAIAHCKQSQKLC